MSQSLFAGRETIRTRDAEPATLTEAAEIGGVLEALEDAHCRTILAATSDDELTVTEVCERFDIAQSTAYRKVDALVEAGLLEERVRIRSSGSHASTYACTVEDVTLSVDGETGVELSVTRTEEETPFPDAGYGRER